MRSGTWPSRILGRSVSSTVRSMTVVRRPCTPCGSRSAMRHSSRLPGNGWSGTTTPPVQRRTSRPSTRRSRARTSTRSSTCGCGRRVSRRPGDTGPHPVKYLILIYGNPESRAIWEGFSDAERAEGYAFYAALEEEMAASGELIVTEALAHPSLEKRVLVREGNTMTTDGPFTEAKELLAG